MAYADIEKRKLNAKKHYYKNLEVNRARNREVKRKERKKNKEKVNLRQREWYNRNRVANAAKINARRIQAYPYRGLRTAIQKCGECPHELSELIRLMRERLAKCDGIRNPTKGFR